ncbi:MAG TPA: response regulator [Polyangiales bacterium]
MSSGGVLLLVEDDCQHAELALRALSRADQLEVRVVESVSEARTFLREHHVDLVLSDLKLPDGSGLELLETGVPLVVQTSQGDEARAVAAMKGGALDYCVKSPEMFRELPRTIERALNAGRNLRERRRAEASLRESDERFRQLAENIPEVFWLLDLGSNAIVYASPAWSSVYGEAERSWRGRLAFVHPDDLGSLEHQDYPSAPVRSEYRVMLDQGVRWVEERLFPIHDAQGTLSRVAGLGSDITRRHELENKLRQAQKMQAVGQLAGGVAHDFNNMLGAIMSAADELALSATPAQQRLCELILQASERAAELTQKMLSFSRMGKVRSAPVDVHQLIGEVVALLERSIDRRVTIVTDLAARTSHVNGDGAQLQSALLNLGINARDAMPTGGELHVSTWKASLDHEACQRLPFEVSPGDFLVVSVRDSGCGIAPTVVPRLFEPFFTTKESGQGTGMGLAAVYGAVVEHRGAVTVETEPGVRTEFRVYLPLLEAPHTPRPALRSTPTGNGLVLLVDDEPLVLSAVSQMLHSLGYEVVTARDGDEALRRVADSGPELVAVVCDAVMPGAFGPDVLTRIAELSPGLPCLLCSGFARDPRLTSGCAEWSLLPKPFRRADLAQALSAAIAARKSK